MEVILFKLFQGFVFCEFVKTPKILFPATMRSFLREVQKKNYNRLQVINSQVRKHACIC